MSKIEYKPFDKEKFIKEKTQEMRDKTHGKTTDQKVNMLIENDVVHLHAEIANIDNKIDYLVQAENERQSKKEFDRSNFHTKK